MNQQEGHHFPNRHFLKVERSTSICTLLIKIWLEDHTSSKYVVWKDHDHVYPQIEFLSLKKKERVNIKKQLAFSSISRTMFDVDYEEK